ncbi:heavy metal translocating P-type ATPase [Rhodococcus ruber]|uniref:heavy metal translocating P-type ATPase n=1 Tax=Rhodococcus ruber TaxID=1830 RepID=UPI000FEF5619|nr:HAD-IC family P-type ATPase [Rhodococcus ruber]RQM33071.1 hypothetical protein TN91_16935 [Rhodococcus ruber]
MAGFVALAVEWPFAGWLFVVSLVAGGVPVALAALRDLSRRKITINLLVTVAAVGALYLGQIIEAAAVMFFFALAEAFEVFGEARSRKAVSALLDRTPETAQLQEGGEMPIDRVRPGTVVVIRPGDTIGLDGVVVAGQSSVDEAAITGESVPKEKFPGETVFAGTLNQNGYLEVEVTHEAGSSVLARIITLVEQAQKSRPPMQDFLDRFASYYIPAAVGAAVLIAVVPPLVGGQPFGAWVTRALILLVLACPDALVVSAPVAVAAAIGGASKKGLLIKGGRYLEVLSKVGVFAFDKTKTLTMGVPVVGEVIALHGATDSDVLADAAGLEKFSSHPLGTAIRNAAAAKGVAAHRMDRFVNVAGRGASAKCLVCATRDHAIGNLEHIGASAETCA